MVWMADPCNGETGNLIMGCRRARPSMPIKINVKAVERAFAYRSLALLNTLADWGFYRIHPARLPDPVKVKSSFMASDWTSVPSLIPAGSSLRFRFLVHKKFSPY